MPITNRYKKRAHITEKQFRHLLKLFSMDIDASTIAKITGLNRNTVNNYTKQIRQRIVEICEEASPFSGVVEIDESYFGARRVKGKRGRGAYGKTPVFGILQRGGKVYTEMVPNCAKKTLQAIIRGKVNPDSIIHSDTWRGYDGLVDVGYQKHFRIKHSQNEFALGKNHINGIESFWSFAKGRLQKYHGIFQNSFNLHLKECEFRFNNRGNNLYGILLQEFRKRALN
jgi:transposase